MPLRQGRLQPTGAVRMLHRVGGRRATCRLRHAGPPRGRPSCHHPRRGTGPVARPLVVRLRRPRGEPVRLLHTGDRHATGRARGSGRGAGGVASRGRGGVAGPFVPLHRVAVHRRGRLRRTGRRRPPRRRGLATRPPARGVAFGGRRAVHADLGSRCGPRWRWVRRRRRAGRRTGPTRSRRAPGARDPSRPRRRRTGPGPQQHVPLSHPVEVPTGDWEVTLQTTWVEPAYVEPDASWSRPGETPASPLANGGAFGGKHHSPVPAPAPAPSPTRPARLVRVLWRREDVVRRGHKRPPLGVGLRSDGTGIVRIGRTEGSADLAPLVARLHELCPGVRVEEVEVAGPPVAPELRGAGWAEVLAALHVRGLSPGPPGTGHAHVALPGAGRAGVDLRLGEGPRGRIDVDVWAGAVLCPVTLRSYALGSVHQALGMVWSEGIAVDGSRRARRPDHPLLRHPRRAGLARGLRPHPRGGPLAGQRLRRRLRRHPGGGVDGRGIARALAHAARRRACAVARRGSIGLVERSRA